jgi:hypothetical protein
MMASLVRQYMQFCWGKKLSRSVLTEPYQRELAGILALPEIDRVEITRNAFVAYTNELYVNGKSIGFWAIRLTYEGLYGVKFFLVQKPREDSNEFYYAACHAGVPCLGNIANTVFKLMNQRRHLSLIQVLLLFLRQDDLELNREQGMVFIQRDAEVQQFHAQDIPIHVVGAGTTGSFVIFALTRMGFKNIVVYDGDKVEQKNVGTQGAQFYDPSCIGLFKVEALQQRILRETGVQIDVVPRFLQMTNFRDARFEGIVIMAVDTMKARTALWQFVLIRRKQVQLLIDARIGGQIGWVYSIKPTSRTDRRFYSQTLYPDERAVDLLCGESIISALRVAALVGEQVARFARGENLNRLAGFGPGNFTHSVP